MKKYFYPLSIVFTVLVLLSACKKELTGDPPQLSIYLTASTVYPADSIVMRVTRIGYAGNSEDTAQIFLMDTVNRSLNLSKLLGVITPLAVQSNVRSGTLGKVRLYLDTVGTHILWQDSVQTILQLDSGSYTDIVINDPVKNGKIYAYNLSIDVSKSIIDKGAKVILDPVISLKRD